MWREGTITVKNIEGKEIPIRYCAKVYDLPSGYGIKKGRISKLSLRQNGEEVLNYDRGWDIKAKTPEAEKALETILKMFA